MGSPEYMSPEQAKGLETVDARTDVWSLTVALYELLTGEMPFKGPNYNALMQAIINDAPVPPRSGDNELWKVLARGLAKNPDDRFASMSELGEAMALWLYQHGVKEDLSGNSIRAIWLDRPLAEATDAPISIKTPKPRSRAMQRFIDTVNGESFTASGQRPRKKQWLLGGAAAASVIAILTLLWSGESSTPPVNATPSHKTPLELAQEPLDVAQGDRHSESAPATSASPTEGAPVKEAETDESSANATRAKASTSKKAHVSPKPKKPKHDFGF